MKTIARKLSCFLFVLMTLLFAACSTETTLPNAVAELEEFADANGEIEITLSLQLDPLPPVNRMQLPEADLDWTYFRGTTPRGKTLEGIIVLSPDFTDMKTQQLGNFEIQDLKVRGKVTNLRGRKVFSGFYVKANQAVAALLAYNAGTKFDLLEVEPRAKSFEAKAEFVTRTGSTAMLVRAKDGILMGLISEDLGFGEGLSKEDVRLELMTQTNGFISQGSSRVTIPGLGRVTLPVVGIFVHISALKG